MANWGDLIDQQESRLASQVSGLNIGQKSGGGAQASAQNSASAATTNAATANAATANAATANAASASASPASASASPASADAANTNTNASTNNVGNNTTEEETEDDKAPSKEEESLLRKLIHSRLLNTKADLEVLRKDPNSPLYSVKSFDKLNLKPELLKGVYNMGFNAPSKIQETALPALLQNPPRNMIAQSQSGTGKTAAFVLAMLSRVDTSKPYTQCLCLAPTYELALQIGEVVQKMATYMPGVIIKYAVRGKRVARGQKLEAHIVIGTPGTLMDWALKFKAIDLKMVDVFVLDEADVMIATQGHQDQSVRIRRNLREDCQMLLFSATYDDEVMRFAESIVPRDPFVIRLRRDEESLDNIRQYYIECESVEAKYNALANIYGSISIGQSMIFCRTRKTANWLAEKMVKDGHAVGLLSGELEIEQRAAIINRFRSGKEKVLITTNVSARGIDVEQVTVVVNFDLPTTPDRRADCETYLHRIGRTGRFGKQGLAINMVDGPFSMHILRDIEKHFGRHIIKLDAEDMDALENLST